MACQKMMEFGLRLLPAPQHRCRPVWNLGQLGLWWFFSFVFGFSSVIDWTGQDLSPGPSQSEVPISKVFWFVGLFLVGRCSFSCFSSADARLCAIYAALVIQAGFGYSTRTRNFKMFISLSVVWFTYLYCDE